MFKTLDEKLKCKVVFNKQCVDPNETGFQTHDLDALTLEWL